MTRQRSPYWRPGMGISEPWVALAQTNTGHLIVPCGYNSGHAVATVGLWQAQQEAEVTMDPFRVCVGAVVVTPTGEIMQGWGDQPTPGGPSRWSQIMRLREPGSCYGCAAARWPGCWVTLDMDGCSACLPEQEATDPRVWPTEPPEPAGLVVAARPMAVPAALKPRRPARAPRFGSGARTRVTYQRDAG